MLILLRVQPEQQAQPANRDASVPGPAAVIACHGQRTVAQPPALAPYPRSCYRTISKRRDGNGLP
jgi:hypothetical protein